MEIILASGSPRRKDLLKSIVPDFKIIVSDADETLKEGITPEEQATRLSYIKAKTVFDKTEGDRIVIGSDTMVVKNNKIYGKPKNKEQANLLNTKWYQNADSMAEAFSSINPFYPKEEVRRMLYEHLRFTTDEVNARLKGDYIADINAYDKVQKEILRMSQFFVNGIVRQFPNLF